MVPAEQNSLEQDRKCADERAGSAPPVPSAPGPNPYGEAHPHFDPVSPPLSAERTIRTRQGDDTV
jgi:hypothetical protein